MSTAIAGIPALVAGSPQALELYRRIATQLPTGTPILIRGCGGSGTSALLSALRNLLQSQQIHSAQQLDLYDPTIHTALLVDDAHLLSSDELNRLEMMARRDDVVLVVAMRRRYDEANVATLIKILDSSGTTVDLTPLDEVGVAAAARAQYGISASPAFARTVYDLTEGLSYLVDAVLRTVDMSVATSATCSRDNVAAAVHAAVTERLHRLDRDVLPVLALESIGAVRDEVDLATLLDVTPSRARKAMADAATCGLMDRKGELRSIIAAELFSIIGRRQLEALWRSLFEICYTAGNLDSRVGATLAELGFHDSRLCEALLDRAESLAGTEPALAERLYCAAIDSNPANPELAIRRAEVALQLGRHDEALGLVDRAWGQVSGARFTSAARVAASAWCARGMLSRGAEIYSWMGADRLDDDGPVAALMLCCAGRPEAAAALITAAANRPPTSEVIGNRLLAQAVLASLEGSGTAALNQFDRALAAFGTTGAIGARPLSPVAVAAVAALHAGDLRRARRVLQRALATEPIGSPLRVQQRLLMAWTGMLEGNVNDAATELSALERTDLSLRDRFLADALGIAIARRRGDTGQLHTALAEASESVDEYAVDLLSLLPIGELWSAASRIGQAGLVQHLVDEAFALLNRLGDPPFWSSALHWFGVTSAIQSDAPTVLTTHAHALRAAAAASEYAGVLATAGATWVRILGGNIDLAEITATAQGLQSMGLSWDGATLAGRAALRCADSGLSGELMQLARTVGQAPAHASVVAPVHRASLLSERQREIAALLVEGLTYKGVGERLFISPKTVEYHVAKIKHSIGTESRSELLSRLHALDLSCAC